MQGRILYMHRFEQIADTYAAPPRIAGGTELPLDTGDRRRVQSTTVTCTLQDARDFGHGQFSQFRQTEGRWFLHFAVYRQTPGFEVGSARDPVAADEEQLVRREVISQKLQRCLRIDGIAVHLQHVLPRPTRVRLSGGSEC